MPRGKEVSEENHGLSSEVFIAPWLGFAVAERMRGAAAG
jgi:hypothetical protein